MSSTSSMDRENVGLPSGLQTRFATGVLTIAKKRGVPVVLLLCNGGAVSIDNLLTDDQPSGKLLPGTPWR